MKQQQSFALGVMLALILSSATVSGAVKATKRQILKLDNSGENALLNHISAPTADDQPNDRADRITAARVRRVIIADDTLSVYAQNVKIIVTGGKVTLAGPVHSDDERKEVAFDVASVVGAAAIVNQITLV